MTPEAKLHSSAKGKLLNVTLCFPLPKLVKKTRDSVAKDMNQFCAKKPRARLLYKASRMNIVCVLSRPKYERRLTSKHDTESLGDWVGWGVTVSRFKSKRRVAIRLFSENQQRVSYNHRQVSALIRASTTAAITPNEEQKP